MKMNIASERHNPYMRRKELLLTIEHDAESTPNKAAVLELLAKQLSIEKEKIEIIDIISETGMAKSRSSVFVWEEVPVKKIKKAEAPKEEAKQEAPETQKEEKKEEKAKAAPAEAPKSE